MKDNKTRQKRKMSIRSRISGTADRPRVTVYRSNKFFYAQAIDDVNQKTVAAVRSKVNPTKEVTQKLGEELGKKLTTKKTKEAVFDRNGYAYHGKIAAFADGLRSAKIKV